MQAIKRKPKLDSGQQSRRSKTLASVAVLKFERIEGALGPAEATGDVAPATDDKGKIAATSLPATVITEDKRRA